MVQIPLFVRNEVSWLSDKRDIIDARRPIQPYVAEFRNLPSQKKLSCYEVYLVQGNSQGFEDQIYLKTDGDPMQLHLTSKK